MDANLRTILTTRNLETCLNLYEIRHGEYHLVESFKKDQRKKLIMKINLIKQNHVLVAMRMINGTPEVCLLSSKFKKVYDVEKNGIKLKRYHPFDSPNELSKQGFIFALKKILTEYTIN